MKLRSEIKKIEKKIKKLSPEYRYIQRGNFMMELADTWNNTEAIIKEWNNKLDYLIKIKKK